jgi:hypothetical protein
MLNAAMVVLGLELEKSAFQTIVVLPCHERIISLDIFWNCREQLQNKQIWLLRDLHAVSGSWTLVWNLYGKHICCSPIGGQFQQCRYVTLH